MPTWNNVNLGLWTDSANWTGGVPNASGATADIVVVGGTGATVATFTENTTVLLGTLNVTSTGARDVLFQGSLADSGSGVATLTFDAGANSPTGISRVNISTAVGGGEFEISGFGGLQVQISSETEFNVSTAGTTARINAPIFGAGQIIKMGAGTLQLGSSNTTFNGTMHIEGGTLYGLNGGALGTGLIFLHNNAILRASGTVNAGVGTLSNETGTTGSGQIMAPTGTTLTFADSFAHRSGGVLTLGNTVDNGTIAFAVSTTNWGAGSFRLAGGTVRFDNSFSAGSVFYGANTTLTELVNGVVLDGRGFQMRITNLDLDNGTIRSSIGALNLLVSDTGSAANAQTGTIEGTANADTVEVDVLNNFTFASTVFTNWSANDAIKLDGSANANNLTGSTFKDTISGFGGNDTLIGGGGADILFGGDGDDLIVINANNGNSEITGGAGTDTLRLTGGSISLSTMSGIEAVELQNGATLALSNGQFFGLGSNPAISGTGTISVSLFSGQSALTNNFNVAAGSNITFVIQAAGGNETIVIHPDAIGIVSDSSGIDTITGGNRGDTITIMGGVDTVNAGAGNDLVVVGNSGIPANGSHVHGGADTDTLRINSGSVTLGTITGFEAIDMVAGTTLTLTAAQFNTGFYNPIAQLGVAAVSGTGTLVFNMDANPVVSELYLSTLSFAGGSNIAITINGTSGIDAIKGAGAVANTINGGDGIDQIRGGNQADTINGGAGDDKLFGWGGADVLTGGTGSDQFRYFFATDSGTGAAADRITDFEIGIDKLHFVLLDADPVTPDDQAFAFLGTGAFTSPGTGQIRYQDSGADLLVQVDVDGNGTVDMSMVLQGLAGQTLTSVDFML